MRAARVIICFSGRTILVTRIQARSMETVAASRLLTIRIRQLSAWNCASIGAGSIWKRIMIAMNDWVASCEIATPETTTAMAITRSCAPKRRQSRLPRTPVGHELVADAADGLDVPRATRVVPQLLAQLADVHVDGAIHDDGLVKGVDVGQQLVAREHAAGKFHQRLQ